MTTTNTSASVSYRPNSRSVDWSRLTPRSREIMAQVALRLMAGYSYEEIAEQLDAERPELKHLPLPKTVTKGWVSARFRELRREAEQVSETH